MKERLLTTLFTALAGCLWAQGAFAWGEEVGGNFTTFNKLEARNGKLYCYGQFFDIQTIGGFTLNSANGTTFRARINRASGVIEEVAQNPVLGFEVSDTDVLKLERMNTTNYTLKRLTHTGQSVWNYTLVTSGTGDVIFEDLAIDAAGNIYILVSFNTGSLQFNAATLSAGEMKGLFVWKINANGSNGWAKKIGGAGTRPGGIETFADGDVLVASQNNTSISLQRLAPDNTVLWTRLLATEQAAAEHLKCVRAASGDVYLGGSFRHGLHSDDNMGSINLTSAGQRDGFLLKYDGDGNVIWARAFGGLADDMLADFAADFQANVYCVGTFANQITFGNGVALDDGFPAANTSASYVAIYRADGSVLSADRPMALLASANQSQFVRVLATDTACYIAGKALGPTVFGALTLGTSLIGSYYPFVVKYENAQVVGVEEVITEAPPALRLWPNPSRGRFTVDAADLGSAGEAVFEVYSATGQLVVRQTGNPEMELDQAPPGLYTVRVWDDGRLATGRVVVSR
jgi:hypothetical protein